jgi:hypothetical protein
VAGITEQLEGEDIDWLARLAGIDPRQAIDGRGKRLRKPGVSDDEIPPFSDEQRAPG